MEAPKGMVQLEEKIMGRFRVPSGERFEESGPLVRENGERTEAALRMIQRTGAAEPPEFYRQNEPLHRVAMRPPAVPEISHVAAGFVAIRGEIGRGEKSGDAKKDRFEIGRFFSEPREGQTLSEKSERKFVLFVAESCRDFLKERRVAPVIFDDAFETRGFALKTKLRGGCEDGFEAILRQVF